MCLRSKKKTSKEVHLDDPIGKDKDDNTITLKDVLENDARPIEDEIDLKLKITKLNSKINNILTERERIIINWRFGLNGKKPKTQIEIAQKLGISRSYVSRIETKAINKLSNSK